MLLPPFGSLSTRRGHACELRVGVHVLLKLVLQQRLPTVERCQNTRIARRVEHAVGFLTIAFKQPRVAEFLRLNKPRGQLPAIAARLRHVSVNLRRLHAVVNRGAQIRRRGQIILHALGELLVFVRAHKGIESILKRLLRAAFGMLARSDEFVAMLKYQSKNASVLPEHVVYELSSESFN